MKTTTMLDQLSELLNSDKRKKKSKRKHLHALLKDLKKRQKQLEDKLAHTDDKEKCHKLKREIEIIVEQRRKGVRLYRKLREK